MDYKKCILLTFFFGLVRCNLEYCDDYSPYIGKINIDEITGIWNGVEMIRHTDYEIESTDECFHIDITERNIQPYYPGLAQQQSIRYFILKWHGSEQEVDYYMTVNPSHKGFWLVGHTRWNGSVDEIDKTSSGIIQVLQVSNKYMVLNFCLRGTYSQLYTVVLARNENQLTAEDLAIIHNTVSSKDIALSNLKRVCVNSAFSLTAPNMFLSILLFIILFTSISQ